MSVHVALPDQLQADKDGLRVTQQQIAAHPLQHRLRDLGAWRTFMEHHVFAVWDFMSLLKRLQRDLTCVQLPWRPAPRGGWARLINDIVLEEESDADGRGGFCSHFELYLEAMEEVGANTAPARQLVALVDSGVDVFVALTRCGAPEAAQAFAVNTLEVALYAESAEVAAVFCWGRESLLPSVFTGLLPLVEGVGKRGERLGYYLRRHIELDGGSHGPAAEQMLAQLCEVAGSAAATKAAAASLEARIVLFDGILAALDASVPA